MFLYAAVLISALLFPTDDLTLGGVVFDTNAKTIAGARVRVDKPTERKTFEATTRDNGTFRFENLALGTYRVTIQKEGYFEVSTEVRLESNKTVEFTLAEAEKLKQEIDVIARPEAINADAVSPQATIPNEVIQNIPFTGRQDFLNAISFMPGVLRDNSNQIHIHGSRPDQIRYELDGMNLSNATSGGLSGNIPIDSIESVDMDLAGYSAEFGKASGGVVRVHSQFIGDKYKFNVTDFIPGIDFRERSIAEFSPRVLFSGPLVQKKLWFMYSGSLRYIHRFLEELPGPGNEQTQTTSDQLLKLQWNLKQTHFLSLDLLHNADFNSNEGLSIVRPREATTNFLQRGTTIGITDRQIRGSKLFETTVQFTHRRNTDLAKGTALLEARPDRWTGNFFADQRGRAQRFHVVQTVAWQRETGRMTHHFKAGAEFDHVNSRLQLDRRPFQLFNAMGTLQSSITFAGPNFAEIRNEEYGSFLQDRMAFTSKVLVELGIRYDRERVTGRNNWSPRVAVSFLPFGTNRSKISGGVGLFYDNIALLNLQLPRMQRRYTTNYSNGLPVAAATATDVRVEPNLRNPSGTHWNAAWENEWAPRWVTRIEYIQKNGHDQSRLAASPTPEGFNLLFNNSGKSRYRALEFTIDRPIRTNLRILGSYTYSVASARPSVSLDFPDPAVESLGMAPVEWNAAHRLVSWGYFPLPKSFNAAFSVEARSGFPFTAFDELNRVVGAYNNHRMPVFFVTNASIEKEIPIPFVNGKHMAFRIGVTNLFNHFNPRFVDQNTNSSGFLSYSDSSSRHFVARVRILKK